LRYRDAHTHLSAGACDLADLDARGDARDRRAREGDRARGTRAAVADAGCARGVGRGCAVPGIAPDHPLWLVRADGHAAWVNANAAAALDLPAAAWIEEDAFDAARRRLPAPADAERDAAVLSRVAELQRLGFGAVDDMVEAWGPELWGRLSAGLPIEVRMWVPAASSPADVDAWRREHPPGARVTLAGVKVFLDGTLGARTAALKEAYADAPEASGTLRLSPGELRDGVMAWASAACRSRSTRSATARSASHSTLSRKHPRPAWGMHRIEHAQVVAPADVARFARARDRRIAPARTLPGRPAVPPRAAGAREVLVHPLGSFVAAGATVLFGSDWPVSSWDPETILSAACDPARRAEALDRDRAVSLLSAHGGREIVVE
jgi:predicted amidohydrolase YtcJ